MEADELLLDLEQSETNSSEMNPDIDSEVLIRKLTLYFVPISFAIILVLGLIGNSLVIIVVCAELNVYSWYLLNLLYFSIIPCSWES